MLRDILFCNCIPYIDIFNIIVNEYLLKMGEIFHVILNDLLNMMNPPNDFFATDEENGFYVNQDHSKSLFTTRSIEIQKVA